MEAFEIFSQGRDVESCGDVSWEDLLDNPEDLSDCEPAPCEPDSCAHVRVVLDVTDVLVSPSSVVAELCDVSPCGSDGEFCGPQSFSKKRAHCGTYTQEEMRYEGSPVKALPLSRRMTPPTPMQDSYTSFVIDHGRYEEEGRGWNARERTIIARIQHYLERSFSVKVQVAALDALLGPEDEDVDLR